MFCVWALLSTAWSTDTAAALDSVGRYALNVLLFLIVFTAVRTKQQLSWVLTAFLIGAAFTALSGIVAPTGEEAAGRLGSVALDPSELSAVLVAGVALALAVIALNKYSPGVQLLAFTAGTFAVVAVWLTASRGGLIALAAALLAAVVLSPRWRIPLAIGGVLVVMATYFYFAAVASPEIRDRITEPTQGQARIEEGRTTIWQVAGRAFEDNPVTGVGTGNFPIVSRQYLLEPGVLARSDEIISTPKVVHNAYLEVATEMGVVGLGLFLLALGFSVGSLVIAARAFGQVGDARMQVASVAVAVAIVGILAALVFTSDQYSKQLWLLLGLGPAVLTMARSEVRAAEEQEPG